MAAKVLLDLTANQTVEDDPYVRLAKEVKRQGGDVIDDPDQTAVSGHKGHLHHRLVEAGVPVPQTVVVPRGGDRFLPDGRTDQGDDRSALRGEAGLGRFRSGSGCGRRL